jgi:hypothetical protein
VDAFVAWAWDFIGAGRASAVLDDPDSARIDWGDEDEKEDGAK